MHTPAARRIAQRAYTGYAQLSVAAQDKVVAYVQAQLPPDTELYAGASEKPGSGLAFQHKPVPTLAWLAPLHIEFPGAERECLETQRAAHYNYLNVRSKYD